MLYQVGFTDQENLMLHHAGETEGAFNGLYMWMQIFAFDTMLSCDVE